jgi:hypothetical protein
MSRPPTSPATVNGPLVAIVDDGRGFVSLHRIPSVPQIDGQTMNVVTLDGLPLTYHDLRWHPEVLKHLLIVQGPSLVKNKALRSLCVCVSTPVSTETQTRTWSLRRQTAIDHGNSSARYVSPSSSPIQLRANDI